MSKIQVGKHRRNYTLNGAVVKPKDFRGVSCFKWVNHIVAWIDGGAHGIGGGVHLSNAKRVLEREVVGLGFKRARTPVELMLWGPPYFDIGSDEDIPEKYRGWQNVANTLAFVNLRSSTGSGFNLTPKMKKTIRMMVILAREFDIVLEFPWCWTIKSVAGAYSRERLGLGDDDPRRRFENERVPSQGGVGIWNEHFLGENGVGAYITQLKLQGDGDGEDYCEAGPVNATHDVMNERTAHVGDPDNDKTNEWDKSQLHNIARRWKTRDAKGELCEISESGKIEYGAPLASQYGVRGFDAVTPHPPRSGMWVEAPKEYRRKWPNELINFNESQMIWTRSQRMDWVELIPKWENLGSTDIDAGIRMYENMESVGGYMWAHTLRGMDGGWPQTPQTAVESALKEFNGMNGAPPPPPPPEEDSMKLVYGTNFVSLQLPDGPIVVDVDADGNEAWTKTWLLTLKRDFQVVAVDSFFGHDRGDAYEMACEIWSDPLPDKALHASEFLWRRIDEATAPHDNDESRLTRLAEEVQVRSLKVHLTCRVTGKNAVVEEEHPSYNKWRGVFDFNAILIGA